MRYLRAFFRFWYDFLVGDRWELFVGPIAALAAASLATQAGVPAPLAGGLLVALVALVGGASIAWASRG
jgi:ABC-type dipeptide/oligopeptide/nickel transport system permease subunit